MEKQEVIIIGSGPAGLTAGIYAARANLNPVIIGGMKYGGQLMDTTEVENYPGFKDGITGPELMDQMLQQADRFGAEIVFEDVISVDFSIEGSSKIVTSSKEYLAQSVIIATGSKPRLLNIASEKKFWGKGISACATCDGAFFRDKEIAVIGGGDSAMEEAIFLTKFGTRVHIIHRRDEFRASKIMADRVLAHPKIEVHFNSTVEEYLGEDTLQGLRLKNKETGEINKLVVQGAFVAIGHIPNTEFLINPESGDSAVLLDESGFIVATNHTETSQPGVFVAGDVYDHRYQQAITAAGMGCMALLDAEKYLVTQ